MNWVDLAVLGVAGLSALIGFARGLVREVLGVGAWLGAAAVAAIAFPFASAKAHTMITDPGIADVVAAVAVFLVALILLSLIASWVGGVVRNSALGGLDRSLGLIFGLVRGAALIVIAYIADRPHRGAGRLAARGAGGAGAAVRLRGCRLGRRDIAAALPPTPRPAAARARARGHGALQASSQGSALDPPTRGEVPDDAPLSARRSRGRQVPRVSDRGQT